MLAVRVKFDRPLRRVSHDSPKPMPVVETAKIPVPVPVQAPPPAPTPEPKPPVTVPLVPPMPPVEEDETAQAARAEEEERARLAELQAMEDRHREEFETLRGTLKQMSNSVEEGVRARQFQMNELQQAAVEIATTVATRLLHREVTEGRFPIEQMVRDMATEIDVDATLTIYLNPTDLNALRNRLDLRDLLPDYAQQVRVAEDGNLARGSCRLETPDSMLLGELGGQLQTIRDELLRSLGHAAGS
jgi:flagellar biosynthesis/type III secretory pathway protein FliH